MNSGSVQRNSTEGWLQSERYPSDDAWTTHDDRSVHLIVSGCPKCGGVQFPARSICPSCHGSTAQPLELSGRIVLYSFTTVHAAVPGFSAPYTIGYADFPEGIRVFAQLRDPYDNAKLASRVTVATDEIRTMLDVRSVLSYVFAVER